MAKININEIIKNFISHLSSHENKSHMLPTPTEVGISCSGNTHKRIHETGARDS